MCLYRYSLFYIRKIIIPTQRVAVGVMFFTRSSVSPTVRQSVSLRYFCQSNSSTTAQQYSSKLCSMKHIVCRCACSQEILIHFFNLDIRSHLNLDILSKWNILLKLIVSATLLKPLHKISWNFVVMIDMMSKCAYLREMLILFFLGFSPLLNLEILPKWNILLKQFVSVTPLKMLHICDNYKWIVCIRFLPIVYHDCLSYCPSLMHGIGIRSVQNCQEMLERWICELAHYFIH